MIATGAIEPVAIADPSPECVAEALEAAPGAAVDAVASGRLDPSSLYTGTYSLDELGRALDDTRDRPDGFLKALVTP